MPGFVYRSIYISRLIASSLLRRLRFASGRIDSATGATTTVLDTESAVAYIHRTFHDYLRYGGLAGKDIIGARLLEIGPGDSLGVGLRFLARGAARYVTLDKFYSRHDPARARAIYERLRHDLPPAEQALFDPARIETFYGHGAQEADQIFAPASFDGILSRAVLHEIYAVESAILALDRVLKPGGWMIHKIDLRDDGLFSSRGFHPLEFLTISDPVYWLLSYDTDKACRRPLPFYRGILRRLNYQARFIITGLIETEGYKAVEDPTGDGKEVLEPGIDYGPEHEKALAAIRPRLSHEFRSLSDSDLLAASVFLAARKPL